MPLVYGNRAKGRLGVMPAAFADTGYTKPGEVYEIHLDTTSFVGKEESVIDQLLTLESQVPDLKIVYAETCSCYAKVKFQVIDTGPGQWSISGIFSLLPAIFVLIGVGIIAYMLWKLYADNPVWLLVGGIAGAFLVLYFFTGEQFFKGIGTVYTPKPKETKTKATPTERLQVEAEAIRRKIDTQKGIIKELKTQRSEALAAHAPTGTVNDITKDITDTDQRIDRLEDELKGLSSKYA